MEARRRTRYRSGRGLLPIAIAWLLCLAPAGAALAAPAQQIFPLKGFDGPVNAVSAPDAQGRIVVGGDFTIYGQLETGGGAALTTAGTGAVDVNLPPVNGDVRAVASDGAGGYYIGGFFSCVGVASGPCTGPGAVQRENLAHILSDGSVDPAWAPAPDQRVFALAVSGSTVYVGGNFTSVGGTPRNAVAAIDATGALTDWNPRPDGSTVYALAVSGSTVYMGGDFTRVGRIAGGTPGLLRTRVAAIRTGARTSGGGSCLDTYDTDDCVTDWNSLATTNGIVYALAVSGSTVYVGGAFTTISGVSRSRIAAIRAGARTSGGGTCLDNFDTSDCVTSWNSVGSTNDTVSALAVSGSTVYVGGGFTTISGVSRSRIAAIRTGARTSGGGTCLDTYAAADCVTAWNPQANDFVLAIASDSGTVYVGGDFTCIGVASGPCTGAGAVERQYLGAVDAATGAATAWNPSADRSVYALLPGSGSIYVGGDFTYWGGTTRNDLAQFDADGNLTAWNPDVDGEVFAVAVSGSTVYVGGNFNCVNRDRPVLGGGSGAPPRLTVRRATTLRRSTPIRVW